VPDASELPVEPEVKMYLKPFPVTKFQFVIDANTGKTWGDEINENLNATTTTASPINATAPEFIEQTRITHKIIKGRRKVAPGQKYALPPECYFGSEVGIEEYGKNFIGI